MQSAAAQDLLISFDTLSIAEHYEALRAQCEAHGQAHVFEFWEQLSEAERKRLLFQLRSFDLELVSKLYKNVYLEGKKEVDSEQTKLEPLNERIEGLSEEERARLVRLGAEKIASGKVAVAMMAGGSGTRLKFDHPKGMYKPGDLPSQKSIFQLLAQRFQGGERFSRLMAGDESKNRCMWLIMTSEENHNETVEFFAANDFFGLKEQLLFFPQGMLPALDFEGKIIMENPGKISRSGNGNGGLLEAFRVRKDIQTLVKERGIEYMQIFGVDNILAKFLDPLMIGAMVDTNAAAMAKVVPKRAPEEKVGVFVKKNGKYDMVEYIEIGEELSKRKDASGRLMFRDGNIVVFTLTTDFLFDGLVTDPEKMEALSREFHVQKKKIAAFDKELNKTVKPDSENNGIKFEIFINQFLLFVPEGRFYLLPIERAEEFAPIKNAEGDDSPATAVALLSQYQKRWVTEAGGKLAGEGICEVSFLLSYQGESLENQVAGKEIQLPVYLKPKI